MNPARVEHIHITATAGQRPHSVDEVFARAGGLRADLISSGRIQVGDPLERVDEVASLVASGYRPGQQA